MVVRKSRHGDDGLVFIEGKVRIANTKTQGAPANRESRVLVHAAHDALLDCPWVCKVLDAMVPEIG